MSLVVDVVWSVMLTFVNAFAPVSGWSTPAELPAKPYASTSLNSDITILPVITATFGLLAYPSPPLVIVTLSNCALANSFAVAVAAFPFAGGSISIFGTL